MLPEVLIAYATFSGSTAEVAEAMADPMREKGIMVEVLPMRAVVSIPARKSLVLGMPLHVGKFPKDFHRFADRFRQELATVRPWMFVLGPTENNPRQFDSADNQARKELARYSWLRPADLRIMGGRFDPAHLHLPFPMNLLLKLPANPMRRLPASDIRDWELIRLWAIGIADRVQANANANGILH